MKDPKDLKRLEQDDLRRRARQERSERKALRKRERRERRRALWPRWVAFWERTAGYLKTAGIVVGSTAGIVSGGIALYRHAADAAHAVRRAWSFYADRDVGSPALPPPTGVATTALDFVTKHPPDGGSTK